MDFHHFATIQEIRESEEARPELISSSKAEQLTSTLGREHTSRILTDQGLGAASEPAVLPAVDRDSE